jgi:predicted nuclease of predicted toxin-antitoxin system
MKFLIDRCAGRLLANWLRKQGHDVVESRELGPDPGDRALLEWAAAETRILVTIDTDFGELIYLENIPHAGLIRLPDVPAHERQLIIQDLLTRHEAELRNAAIITVRGGRIRISKGPNQN